MAAGIGDRENDRLGGGEKESAGTEMTKRQDSNGQ